jgi:hypothetical protein
MSPGRMGGQKPGFFQNTGLQGQKRTKTRFLWSECVSINNTYGIGKTTQVLIIFYQIYPILLKNEKRYFLTTERKVRYNY